ncbi:uncharacterized protein LOC125369864 [Ricinus communis]|uniref:uncharacterized protein LOC125369864 n=1 Tax=Ricinus communis TaxID=3988 RepID=UPI00201AC739|nr:uncharacterized protein LOC125369864 [Ricinus communis]
MTNPPREVEAERRMTMKDYAMPTIGNTTSCIVLDDTFRNYELKSIHFNMFPSFYGWRNHPKFSWKYNDQNPPQLLRNQNQPHYQDQYSQFQRDSNPFFQDQEQTLRSNEQRKPSLEETLQSFMIASHDRMERNEKKTDSIEASLKRLEAQMEQIVEELNKEELSSQSEQANSIITIRRGTPKNDGLVQSNEESIQKEEKVEPNLRLEKKEKEAFSGSEFHKAAQNKPAHAKFFEELNTNKRRYTNNEKVQVASVMLQHQLPLKMKDPGSFTIYITIGDKKHTKAMLDLEASINLMPYTM